MLSKYTLLNVSLYVTWSHSSELSASDGNCGGASFQLSSASDWNWILDYFTQLIRNIIVNNLFNILFYIPIEIKNDRTTNFHKQSIDNQMNFKLNLCNWAYCQSAKTFRSHNLYLYMYVCVCVRAWANGSL